ncbi:MAG: reverse transcriptase domain-containing protein [Syntrophobacteraceae bacterium]|nr:reverse transcriptase domain-containing protein [Syntrophobacteraceae bacterium]
MRFTALLHHIYSTDTLREAYYGLKREAAPGVDGVTWRVYGEGLEENLRDLSDRLKRGAYRAKPTRRTFIPKPDGRQRPLGVMALEDKIVQRASVEVLNAIYEVDFLGFSYGFRPGRSPHNALDALYTALLTRKVNWVLDADICGFFDAIDRKWLIKFIEHRIGDRRVMRLIQKWLNAGVLEDGKRIYGDKGTVQGGSISPLLVVVGFEHRDVAEQFLEDLRQRMAEFGLELHNDKTRLLEFGPYAAKNRKRAGLSKPETFNFLGFTHICAKKRSNGMSTVLRQTMRKRLQAKLTDVKYELRRRLHDPVPEVGRWLASVVRGHVSYYGVPGNGSALWLFRYRITWLWWRTLRRRSQKNKVTWERMKRLIDHWIPPARICHPYPLRRLGVIT